MCFALPAAEQVTLVGAPNSNSFWPLSLTHDPV